VPASSEDSENWRNLHRLFPTEFAPYRKVCVFESVMFGHFRIHDNGWNVQIFDASFATSGLEWILS